MKDIEGVVNEIFLQDNGFARRGDFMVRIMHDEEYRFEEIAPGKFQYAGRYSVIYVCDEGLIGDESKGL